MSALEFIVQDTLRQAPKAGLRPAALGLLTLLGVAFAFGLRDDFVGVFTWAYLGPSLAMVPALGAGVWACLSPTWPPARRGAVIAASFAAMLGLSFLHPGASIAGFYATPAAFWYETLRCFTKGLVASGLAAAGLTVAAFRWLPLPGARVRLACGLTSGLVGVFALNLHCASPDPRHIFLGHWGQALPLLGAALLWQRWMFARAVSAKLGPAAQRLRRLGRLG